MTGIILVYYDLVKRGVMTIEQIKSQRIRTKVQEIIDTETQEQPNE